MPTGDLVQFILIIAPGFLVHHIYRTRYPAKRVSQFTEITLSVVFGVGIYALVTWFDTRFLSMQLSDEIHLFVLFLFAVGFVTGRFWVCFRHIRFRLPEWFPFKESIAPQHKQYQSVWPLMALTPDWAVVFLRDGSIYMGKIDYFTFDPNADNQDFRLTDARRVNENLEEMYLVTGAGVYLNTKDVTRIEFLKSKTEPTS